MFYSEAILARRGPLARVWLAAHMERKLSKSQTLQTDITQSVGAIMGQDVEVMALRLSGQLLLGVVRIYSRKAKYLLDDCNEALLKIKMAFRPAVVDMTEDQLAANKNAITLPEADLDLDLMLPDLTMDFDILEAPAPGQHIARQADITLVNANELQMDYDSLEFGLEIGVEDGIGSQDFEQLDLGLDFGDVDSAGKVRDDADDSMSVELGRDAPSGLQDSRLSVDMLLDHDDFKKNSNVLSPRSRDASEVGGANFDFDVDMDGNFDLGLNFGDGNDEQLPPEKPVESRASSPLTELPETPPETTPRAGDRAEGEESAAKKKSIRKPKDRKQIIDADIELKGFGGNLSRRSGMDMGSQSQKDVSAIITTQRFLPASRTVMRLLEIRSDPVAYFMPMKPGPGGNLFFNAGPPGLAPELSELFMRPITNLHLSKRRGDDVNGRPSKKPRREVNGEADEVEIGRREASVARSTGIASDLHPGGDMDFGPIKGPTEDFQVDGDFQFDASAEMHQEHLDLSKLAGDETRVSTPAADFAEELEAYADINCPIATFDVRQPSQTQDEANDIDEQDQKKGYSKNTMKALSILRRELDPKSNPEGGEKVLSFSQMSEKASRRAASSFFFELLVLGTRDCLKLSQAGSFENIEIKAKDRLWEHKLRTERLASVAPSVISAL